MARLDLEPDAEPRLRRPDGHHVGREEAGSRLGLDGGRGGTDGRDTRRMVFGVGCRRNMALPATKELAPASADPAVSAVMPPSTSRSIGRPAIRGFGLADLGPGFGNEALAAEAGVDAHHQHQIDVVDDVLDGERRASPG